VAETSAVHDRLRWYRSFYWQIGLGFVTFVIAVIVAQSVTFSYLVSRSRLAQQSPSPPNPAIAVEGDLRSALARNRGLDLRSYLVREYGRSQFQICVVMNDGLVACNGSRELSDMARRTAAAALAGTDFTRAGGSPVLSGPPIVTAPIHVGNELIGMVVVPPAGPSSGILRDVGRVLSLPGTLVLIVATALAAALIFGPARRRLRALEDATERLGAGDLAARAPERGGDEIARLARSFNRMASELASRDEAIRTSDRLRRQMFADVSHELKTPLTAMRGYLETLQMPDVVSNPPTRQRYLDIIESETVRLDRIVKDLLDLARYENGVGSLEVRVFDIERLFTHVVRRHEHEARTRSIAVRTSVAESADQVVADPDRIEQVIENLVANALRHTSIGGAIELRATAGRDAICLSVVDSGDGIAPEHIPHVFDRFYKVDASRTDASAGSGLGLSIAKAIVDRHGGTIEVTSVPGRTEFRIVLPQAAKPRLQPALLQL
jgi:two-component system sensor histidine kinase BaeS